MKNLLFLSALVLSIAFITSCDKTDDDEATYDYHAHINAPDATDKHVGDTMHIHVEFESHTGEEVYNVNVRIYNADDSTEVYNMPIDGHVHADGSYSFHDDFVLSNDNGVVEHTDWILEAKVWGHEAGEEEVSETVQFHVHP